MAPNGGNVGIGDASPTSLLTVGNGDLFQVTSAGYVRGPNALPANPTYSFTTETNSGLYRYFTNDIRMSVGGTDRMRFGVASNSTAEIWVNLFSPYTGDVFSSTSATDGDYGVNGYNTSSTATTGGGVYGEARGGTTFGIWGVGKHANGTGTVGSGNNLSSGYLAAGSGGAFTGNLTGVYAKTISAATGTAALYSDNFGSIVRVNYYNGTQYKINGAGSVSTIVKDLNGEEVTLHCPESPEIYFTDYGEGQLVDGVAHIDIDPIFAKNVAINDKHPLRVFIQLEGDCNGVFVCNKTATGFDVKELQGGKSNTKFQWNIICNRADEDLGNGRISKNADMRFEKASPPLKANNSSKENERK